MQAATVHNAATCYPLFYCRMLSVVTESICRKRRNFGQERLMTIKWLQQCPQAHLVCCSNKRQLAVGRHVPQRLLRLLLLLQERQRGLNLSELSGQGSIVRERSAQLPLRLQESTFGRQVIRLQNTGCLLPKCMPAD